MKMKNMITLKPATFAEREPIISLLKSENLPTEDIGSLENFFVAFSDDEAVGAIGLEVYGNGGLLRSLIVNSSYRKQNIAGELISALEARAIDLGINEVYLLTETAPGYFETRGFIKITRDEVPDNIKSSSEFSSVCPASAIVMKKNIQ